MDVEKVYFAASDIAEAYLSPNGSVETVYLPNSDVIEIIFAEHAGDPFAGAVKTINDTPPNMVGNVDVTFSTIRGYPEVRKATDYLNAQGEFKPISIGGASSASIYMSNEDSAVAGYKKLNYTPDAAETIKTITANNNTVVGEAYLMDDQLNTTIFDAGTWFFNYFRSVSSSAQESFKGLDVFVRHANGTETLLFSLESASIEDTVLTERQVTYTQQAFSVDLTDRLGVRSKFRTTRNTATILSYVVGGARGWGMRTPLAIDHGNTRNKNANPDFQHITLAEKTRGALATGMANPSPISGKDLSTVKKLAQEFDKVGRLIGVYTPVAGTSAIEIKHDMRGNPLYTLGVKQCIISIYAKSTATSRQVGYLRINNVTSNTYKQTGNLGTGMIFRNNAELVAIYFIDFNGFLTFFSPQASSVSISDDSSLDFLNYVGFNRTIVDSNLNRIDLVLGGAGVSFGADSVISIYAI